MLHVSHVFKYVKNLVWKAYFLGAGLAGHRRNIGWDTAWTCLGGSPASKHMPKACLVPQAEESPCGLVRRQRACVRQVDKVEDIGVRLQLLHVDAELAQLPDDLGNECWANSVQHHTQ